MQNNFSTTFILEFTKELIKNSSKKKITSKKENIPKEFEILKKQTSIKPKKILQKIQPIPKPITPQKSPMQKPTKINLGKLNTLIENQIINAIECQGANTPIKVVQKTGISKLTNIMLTKEEIENILETFSNISKTPLKEGVYKATVGNLTLFAIISEVIETKFTIKKLNS